MKRIIAAALLAATAGSVLAVEIGAPYEQLQTNRRPPNGKAPAAPAPPPGGAPVFGLKGALPYEQAQIDRQLPNVKAPVTDTASGGATVFGFKGGLPYEQAQID